MPSTLHLSNIRFVRAPDRLRTTGLLGWATVTVNDGLDLGYLGVRRTRDGRYVLAFPKHTDSTGQKHPIISPLDQATRDAITEQVIGELRRQGRLA